MAWSPEVRDELLRRLHDEAVPWVAERTVVIYALAEGGLPVPRGSGVLLQVADRGFVATAAHVLEGWGTVRFVLSLQEDGAVDLTSVQAELTCDKDNADFALLPLDDEMFELISRSKRFVRFAETDVCGDEPAPGVHAIVGYPTELVRRSDGEIVSWGIYYPTTLKKVDDLDPRLSICLALDVDHTDADGERVRLPALQGVSGCGMWRLHTKGDNPAEWDVDRIRLVGIEHTVVGAQGVIKGVRVRQVLGGIAQRFPELARSIGLTGIVIASAPCDASDAAPSLPPPRQPQDSEPAPG